MGFTCTKAYRGIPFAHRQPNHEGHCSKIHGHNWDFVFTFTAADRDECGFVQDFGDLGWLKEKLNELDHTLALNANDPLLGFLSALPCADIKLFPDVSCEGLARWYYEYAQAHIVSQSSGRVRVASVTVIENANNSATYAP